MSRLRDSALSHGLCVGDCPVPRAPSSLRPSWRHQLRAVAVADGSRVSVLRCSIAGAGAAEQVCSEQEHLGRVVLIVGQWMLFNLL